MKKLYFCLVVVLASAIGGQAAIAQVFPGERLAGPKGKAGLWSVIDYKGDFTATQPADNVVLQILDMQGGGPAAMAEMRILDVTDPDTNGTGGPALTNTLGNGMYTYPSDEPGTDDNDMISVAHGRIKVGEPGKYTFNMHSDDGFALRIFGANFDSVAGNGSLDPLSANTMLHAGDTGDSNTQAVTTLAAGEYNVEVMSWERGGGAFYEFSAAKGDFIAGEGGKRPQWLGVGDPKELPERIQIPGTSGIGRLTKPLTIVNVNEISPGDGIEALRETVLGAGDGDGKLTDGHIFVIDDHNISPSGCPFGVFPHDGDVVQWPNTDGDINNFVAGIFGSLILDDGDATGGETLEVSFHVDSDDRSLFRIKGQDFTEQAPDNGEGATQTLFEIEGDVSMFADFDTCNANYTGVINLKEGVTYDFEGILVENGGDAGMQVLVAPGNQIENFDAADFTPLSLPGAAPITFARNIGFTLVPEVEGLPGDFNANGSLDAGDLDLLATGMMMNDPKFSLDGDNDADIDDRLKWVNELKRTYMGDSNLDLEFNSGDLVVVFVAGKYETGGAATWAQGDWNGDKQFNSSDLVTAFQGGGYEKGPRAAVAGVPEPSSIVLALFGFLSLVGVARSRK